MSRNPQGSVDALARARAAQLLEAYKEGDLSSDELESRWPESADPALDEIRRAVWLTYDDVEPSGAPISAAERALLERCMRFLRTNEPYEWPVPRLWERILGVIVGMLTLGLVKIRSAAPTIDEPWPFLH